MRGVELLLPDPLSGDREPGPTVSDLRAGARIAAWIDARIDYMRAIWSAQSPSSVPLVADPAACIEQLIGVMLHKRFNHQSRGRLAPLVPDVRRRLEAKISGGQPITFFLLYNGGYRGSPAPDRLDLTFSPDQTELLLLFQITRLQQQIARLYSPGVDFTIVINNGVSYWTNDIAISATETYVHQLRCMIHAIGAEVGVHVLAQSETPDYRDETQIAWRAPESSISIKEHRLVERFLGRRCSADEARRRSALYLAAEAVWSGQLTPMAEAQSAIVLRQVAHPATLSFRPFPAGAIRSQNGALGFRMNGQELIPTLVTSSSFEMHRVTRAPYVLPDFIRRDPPARATRP